MYVFISAPSLVFVLPPYLHPLSLSISLCVHVCVCVFVDHTLHCCLQVPRITAAFNLHPPIYLIKEFDNKVIFPVRPPASLTHQHYIQGAHTKCKEACRSKPNLHYIHMLSLDIRHHLGPTRALNLLRYLIPPQLLLGFSEGSLRRGYFSLISLPAILTNLHRLRPMV